MEMKTVLNWKPLTAETALIPGNLYLLSNGHELDAAEYSVENGVGLFYVHGYYIEIDDSCDYKYVADAYLPEV